MEELNDPVPVATADHLDQAGAYALITAESTPQKIRLQIGLTEWGVIERPFLAYYGRVHLGEIAKWWKDHGNFLFAQNLRLFYYSSDVNEALKSTLASEPEYFWYFNNGITIICDSVVKGLVGSPGNAVGVFACEGVSVVNGAQTVGSIGGIVGGIPDGADPPQGWVQARIISLEKCPPEFARRLTRVANLQNAVTIASLPRWIRYSTGSPQTSRLTAGNTSTNLATRSLGATKGAASWRRRKP